jgi:hypothetical protein
MKKYILLLMVAGFAMSCNKDFDSLNTDTKKPKDVEPAFLFSGAQRQLSDVLTNSNVNFNIFRLLAQYWTETTYIDESNYDLNTRNIPQNFWNQMYVDVIEGLVDCQAQLNRVDPNLSTAASKNKNACTEIMIVYSYSILVNTYGNVPYSEALNIINVYPKYDDAAEIYGKLLTRLDAAMAALDPAADGFGSADLLLGGNIGQWKVFGNSIKLKLGMMLADSDPTLAKATVQAAAPNVMASSDDNVIFHYMGSPPNTNPIWVDLVQSNRKDFVAANTIVDAMKPLGDPRIPEYFTVDATGGYTGGPYGDNNNYSTYSKPGSRILSQDFESIIMDYSEVSFLLAEAVERNFISGVAANHYEEGIRASMNYWGISDALATAYLQKPEVAYATAAGDWKQKIGVQKWIALYNRGFDAWTEIRRLDQPVLALPADAVSGYPVRYTYPVQEQNLNTANWEKASSDIGGDVVETKLFWDKN